MTAALQIRVDNPQPYSYSSLPHTRTEHSPPLSETTCSHLVPPDLSSTDDKEAAAPRVTTPLFSPSRVQRPWFFLQGRTRIARVPPTPP